MMLEVLASFLNVVLHIDKYLSFLLNDYGVWIYIILFVIIFCETGLVFTPFLPGDSLVFAIGALAAQSSLNMTVLWILLMAAAILGDTVNYAVGSYLGAKVFHKRMKFIKREYLVKTEQFYEVHGNKTIFLARFIPIMRTFAPFVAGIGKMKYTKFLGYNIAGGIVWISLFLFAGYYFGDIALVKENFSLVILGIIVRSFIPVSIEFIKHRRKRITVQ